MVRYKAEQVVTMRGSVLELTSLMSARNEALFQARAALKGVPLKRFGVGVDLDCCLASGGDKVLAVWDFLFECGHLPVTYLTRHCEEIIIIEQTLSALWRLKFPWGEVRFNPSSGLEESRWSRVVIAGSLGRRATGVIPVVYLGRNPVVVQMHHRIMGRKHVPHLSVWVDRGDGSEMDITLPTEVRVFRAR